MLSIIRSIPITCHCWAPKVVLLLVLLVSFLQVPSDKEFQVLEFFAGVGRIAALSKYVGFSTAAIDIGYHQQRFRASGKRSPMDMNSDSGLVCLVCTR